MLTEHHAHTILAESGLSSDMEIQIVTINDGYGRYYAHTNTMQLSPSAPDCTIRHEGLHAEHYAKLGLINDVTPRAVELDVGLGLISELYVGLRMSSFPECATRERKRLQYAVPEKTFFDLATRFNRRHTFAPTGDVCFIQIDGFKLLLVSATSLGIEISAGKLEFFSDPRPSSGYVSLLASAVSALEGMALNSELENIAMIERFGAGLLAQSHSLGLKVKFFAP